MPQPAQLMPVRETVKLTRLGFGAATQGGLFHSVPPEAAEAVFQGAWDAGIRYFDTAPWYGFGSSEQRLGEFLRGKRGYVISSKVGRLLSPDAPVHGSQLDANGQLVFQTPSQLNVVYDYSYDGTLRSIEASLERMGLERIDIAFLHDPDVIGVTTSELMRGAGKALTDLREQGLLSAIGAGMNQWQQPLELAQTGAFDVFLLASRYTLLEQTALPLMQYCHMHQVAVVIGGVYNSGLLTKPSASARYDYAAVPPALLERALALERVCLEFDVPLRAAALHFAAAHPTVASVLVAARSVTQLEDNVTMFQHPIPLALWASLREAGLIDPTTPEVL